VNDFYSPDFQKVEFLSSVWKQKDRGSEPASSQPASKVFHIDSSEFPLIVEDSTFDCDMPFERVAIFTLDREESNQASLFTFSIPNNDPEVWKF